MHCYVLMLTQLLFLVYLALFCSPGFVLFCFLIVSPFPVLCAADTLCSVHGNCVNKVRQHHARSWSCLHITVTSLWARWRLKSSASWLFTQPFIQALIKENTKLRCVTGFCAGNSPVTGEFPAQMASNVENVSIWWRHHEMPFAHPELTTQHGSADCSISDCTLV